MCVSLRRGILLESACSTAELDASGRTFAVTYLTTEEMTPEELRAAFERYLEGLTCH